ncbi:MAG: hypothetical protein ACTSRA_01730 [Promethearchaeota archaeon]
MTEINKKLKLIQQELCDLITVAVQSIALDLGRFTTSTLKNTLLEMKDDLKIEFDSVNIHPVVQPRESSDIEFLSGNKVIFRLSVKTAVVGNIESTINKLRASKRAGEHSGIILGVGFYKSSDEVEVKLVLCLIPDQTLHS